MTESVQLKMKRLDSLLTRQQAENYPHWVVEMCKGQSFLFFLVQGDYLTPATQ